MSLEKEKGLTYFTRPIMHKTSLTTHFLTKLIRPLIALFLFISINALPVHAQLILDVNTLSDTDDFIIGDGLCLTVAGECSLRAAIQETNAHPNGAELDEITFYNIPQINGRSRIDITAPLTPITDGVIIRGGTSPTGLTRIDGFIHSPPSSGLNIAVGGDGTIVRGLVVSHFIFSGIAVAADDVKIQYSYIGTNPEGDDIGNWVSGIYAYAPVSNLQIGGNEGKGNVIGRNGQHGIDLPIGDTIRIAGNRIGVCEDGSNCRNVGTGINTSSAHILIGGPAPEYGNTIGYNTTGIILLDAPDAVVQNNYIGVTKTGESVGNIITGLVVSNPSNTPSTTVIGHNITEEITIETELGNTIAYNGANGIIVRDNDNMNTTIRGNQIYENGDEAIDLNVDGVSLNDVGDADGGANKTQNYPVLLGMAYNEVRDAITLEYEIDTELANATYPLTVDFYLADDDVSLEGKTFVASDTYDIPGTIGEGQIELEDVRYVDADVLVATATDADGNTSEFSLPSATLGTVVSAASPDFSTLRISDPGASVFIPDTHLLSPAYPNPFNPQTTFTLQVKNPGPVRISLHDALGRRIALLHDGELAAGSTHTYTIDGHSLATGTYLLRIVGAGFIETQQLVLVK